MGAPILMLNAHAVARTMCLCKNFSLDPQGNHVLTCKKHTAATRGHNRVMNVLEQLAHKTGYSMRVNLKVSTTADASNKQGDVKLVNFGLDGSNNLVIDVSICCDHHTITQVAAFQAWVTGPCFLAPVACLLPPAVPPATSAAAAGLAKTRPEVARVWRSSWGGF